MASAALERLGPFWLTRGAIDVRFVEPFYEGEEVSVAVADQPDGRIKIEAGSRASATAWMLDESPSADYAAGTRKPKQPATRETIVAGTILAGLEKTLDLSQPGVCAPLEAFIGPERFAHPAVILGLANELLMHNYELGPWIHASSEIRNASPARDGECVHARGKIVDAYERKGHEFVVLDVAVVSGTHLLTRIRHTAIWKPRK